MKKKKKKFPIQTYFYQRLYDQLSAKYLESLLSRCYVTFDLNDAYLWRQSLLLGVITYLQSHEIKIKMKENLNCTLTTNNSRSSLTEESI